MSVLKQMNSRLGCGKRLRSYGVLALLIGALGITDIATSGCFTGSLSETTALQTPRDPLDKGAKGALLVRNAGSGGASIIDLPTEALCGLCTMVTWVSKPCDGYFAHPVKPADVPGAFTISRSPQRPTAQLGRICFEGTYTDRTYVPERTQKYDNPVILEFRD